MLRTSTGGAPPRSQLPTFFDGDRFIQHNPVIADGVSGLGQAIQNGVWAAVAQRCLAGIHPIVTDLERRLAGLRVGRSGAVMEALVPTVLAQKVIGAEASFAYRAMVRSARRPAPAPDNGAGPDDRSPGAAYGPLLVPPDSRWLASTQSWAFHRWGVEHRRAGTIKTAAAYAHRLEEAATMPLPDARRRLAALPGIGPWTVNTVAMLALGDSDAVNVGDYWLKHVVTFALTGEPRDTDERMLDLLEPWRGQRGRVCRLLLSGAPRPPRYGPRSPLRKLASQ